MNLNRHTLGGTLEQQDGNTTHSLSGNFASKLSEVVGVQGHVNHQFESGLAVGGGANVSIGVDAKKGAPKVEFGWLL
jgi:hypothetical protein